VKIISQRRRVGAFTVEELLIVVGMVIVLVIVAMMVLPALARPRGSRINCTNQLKQVGLAFRVWAADNNDKYPSQVSVTNGGTMELGAGTNAFMTFMVLSNELNSPRILICPRESDHWRIQADHFGPISTVGRISYVSDTNLSYFAGLDADGNAINPGAFLTGDHNLTNDTAVRNGLLVLRTNHLTGWTAEVHERQGNIGLADGSLQTFNTGMLRQALANTGFETNRLAMP